MFLKHDLDKALVDLLTQLQDSLQKENKLGMEFYANRGLYLPTYVSTDVHFRIVRLLPEESFCLSSKDKVRIVYVIIRIRSKSRHHQTDYLD